MISESEEGVANQPPSQEGLNQHVLEREKLGIGNVDKMKKKKSKRSSRGKDLGVVVVEGIDESESSKRKKKKKEKKKKKRLAREMESESSLLTSIHKDNSARYFDFEESLKSMGRGDMPTQKLTRKTSLHQGISNDDYLSDGIAGEDLEWGATDTISPVPPNTPSTPQAYANGYNLDLLDDPASNTWFSSSVAESMKNGSKLSWSPKKNKQSIMDDLASFAGASLATSADGTSDLLSLAGSLGTHESAEVVSHEVLVGFMVSMGTPRTEAEIMAFSFMSHQQSMKRSTHSRATSSREISTHKTTFASRPSRDAMSTSSSKVSRSMRAMVREDISHASAASYRRNRNYVRADEPGAVEMEGRAFGAPIRFPSNDSIQSGDAVVGIAPDFVVEALPVEHEEERELVFADSSPLPVKALCTKGPVRRVVISAMLLLAAAIGIICYFVISARRPPPVPEESSMTMAPSASPTFVTDSILDVALELSGENVVRAPNSPQFRAAGWLSSKDKVDHEDYDSLVQRYAMVTFFYATNGENWLEKGSWLDPMLHECDWGNSISCTTDVANRLLVSGIDLTRNGLSGYMPAEVGLLNQLAFLKLSKNAIAGTLPPFVGQLTRLVTIDMGFNQINGLLPDDIGGATDLDTLTLSGNLFSGRLPSSLWNLHSLRILDLRSNQLMGTIAAEINQLTKLVSLDLGMNSFYGAFPRNISSLAKLDFFLLE